MCIRALCKAYLSPMCTSRSMAHGCDSSQQWTACQTLETRVLPARNKNESTRRFSQACSRKAASNCLAETVVSPSIHVFWLQAFKIAVGRSYRLVDRLDVVPALPPFNGYVHIDYSQWIQVRLACCMSYSPLHARRACDVALARLPTLTASQSLLIPIDDVLLAAPATYFHILIYTFCSIPLLPENLFTGMVRLLQACRDPTATCRTMGR